MPRIVGTDRNQLEMLSLESLIGPENSVRVIDAFVDVLDLGDLGFKLKGKSKEGRPAYKASVLLKIYMYGYLNKTRTTRLLEKCCKCNVEMWWLVNRQQPCYKTISDFRTINRKELKGVFRSWNKFCKGEGLFSNKESGVLNDEQAEELPDDTIAVDGSKFRAQNSKKNNFNEKKLDRHLKYIDNKIDRYLDQLDEQDKLEKGLLTSEEGITEKLESLKEVKQKYEDLKERKQKYEDLKEELEKSEERQISLTDEDARAMPFPTGIAVGYNVQTATHATNKLIAEFEVTNEGDSYALSSISKKAKDFLELNEMKVLADAGYPTASELKACEDADITPFVSPKKSTSKKPKAFRKESFVYNKESDCYICPNGETLYPNKKLYTRKLKGSKRTVRYRTYKAKREQCEQCPFKEACGPFGTRHNSRRIDRIEHENYIDANKKRLKENPEFYRHRQAIVEHPFGTIKRSWGYDYTLLKGKEKVTAEFSLIFLTYNMRRAISILGVAELLKRLKKLRRFNFDLIQAILSRLVRLFLVKMLLVKSNFENRKLHYKLICDCCPIQAA